MIRDCDRLEHEPHDLLVIGGGIYGAWTAYDAALRGLRVALIEKGDWASGTSSASTKLIHGGLRYLEQARFGLVRKALTERRLLATLGPHRVKPMQFLVPLYNEGRIGARRLRLGLWLYDRLAGEGQHTNLRPECVRDAYPFLRGETLGGGCTYRDCQTDDAQFTLEVVWGAQQAGATVANYVEASELLVSKNRVTGAVLRDHRSERSFEVHAAITILTTGPWASRMMIDSRPAAPLRTTKGVHLILPALPTDDAMLFTARQDGRVFFIIPWYNRSLLGTTDTDYAGDPDDVRIDDRDIEYLLEEANGYCDAPQWDRSRVLGAFAGVRALKDDPGRAPSSVSRKWNLESPREGLLVSVGGKYTSARAEAATIVQRALRNVGRNAGGSSPTRTKPFPWAPPRPVDRWVSELTEAGARRGLDRSTAELMCERYGARCADLHTLIGQTPSLAKRIHPELPFCRAELVYGVTETMALTLEDLLRRRTPVLILAPARRDVLEATASLVTPLLGWSEGQRRAEVSRTLTLHPPGLASQTAP